MKPTAITSEIITLRDGSAITLRRAQEADVERLIEMHERLSDGTKYLRYMGIAKHLSPVEAHEMCAIHANADMAIVASSVSAPDVLIGIAYYLQSENLPNTAEVAVLVEDEWQDHGLGSIMLERLASYAIYHGIRVFTATVNWENSHILHFVERSGLPHVRLLNQGIYEISVMLPTLEEFIKLNSKDRLINGTN